MKWRRWGLVLAVPCVLLVLLGASLYEPDVRWEYGKYIHFASSTQQHTHSWYAGGKAFQEESARNVATKAGLWKAVAGPEPELVFLNAAGWLGWEVVSHQSYVLNDPARTYMSGAYSEYILKRKTDAKPVQADTP